MVVIMRLLKNLVFLCPKWSIGRFWNPIVSSFVFLYLFCNIHVTGISTELGGAYSSGAPGLTSISEVHVFTQFCHINVLRIYGYGIPLIGTLIINLSYLTITSYSRGGREVKALFFKPKVSHRWGFDHMRERESPLPLALTGWLGVSILWPSDACNVNLRHCVSCELSTIKVAISAH